MVEFNESFAAQREELDFIQINLDKQLKISYSNKRELRESIAQNQEMISQMRQVTQKMQNDVGHLWHTVYALVENEHIEMCMY